MTDSEERYIHFAACIERLHNAWTTLNAIKGEANSRLVGPAFRYALVEYSTPYTASEGVVKRRHKLDGSCVPSAYMALHERILTARHKIHAHTDLTVRDAKLYLNEIQGKRYASIASNTIHGLEELGQLEEIVRLIEGTLESMFIQREEFERSL